MQTLFKIIEKIYPFPEEFQHALSQLLRKELFSRRVLLIQPGQVSQRMYFLEKGLVRGYYLNNDKEITTGFMGQYDFVISSVSFYAQQPSFEYLETLDACESYSISYQQLHSLYADFKEFNAVGRVITEQYYARSELRAHYLRMLPAEERYAIFTKQYAHLIARLSNKHITSFLGITSETLSRIRARKT